MGGEANPNHTLPHIYYLAESGRSALTIVVIQRTLKTGSAGGPPLGVWVWPTPENNPLSICVVLRQGARISRREPSKLGSDGATSWDGGVADPKTSSHPAYITTSNLAVLRQMMYA